MPGPVAHYREFLPCDALRPDVLMLAAHILRRGGRDTVVDITGTAGVSRQHLSRQFRERLGVGQKLYVRLARFHIVLAYAGSEASVDWARAALDMGLAEQSHMIAECRRFAGLTPHAIASRELFHPFLAGMRRRAGAECGDQRLGDRSPRIA